MKDFKYEVGTKLMGIHDGTPVVGEVVKRFVYGNQKMYELKIGIHHLTTINESSLFLYNGFKWKQAMNFWEEGNALIKSGTEKKKMSIQVLSETRSK